MYRTTPQQVPTSKTSIYGAVKHTHTGDEIVNNPIDLSTDGDIWVNGARIDEYEANGSYGRPFKTITEAMDVAESGNTVKVAPGDYDEEITIPTGVNLVGLGNLAVRVSKLTAVDSLIENIFVDYDLPEKPYLQASFPIFAVTGGMLINCKSTVGLSYHTKNNCKIAGCNISRSYRAANDTFNCKIYVALDAVSNLSISDSIFIMDEAEYVYLNGSGLYVEGGIEGSNVLMSNCIVKHLGETNSGDAIVDAFSGSTFIVSGCDITNEDAGYAFSSITIESASFTSKTLIIGADVMVRPTISTNKEVIVNGNKYTAAAADLHDNDGTVYIKSNSGAKSYTLPNALKGIKFRFLWTANVATATTITTAVTTDSTGDMLRGGLLVCAAAGVNTFVEASGDVNKMTFDDDLPNSAAGIGSWVQVECVENGIWLVTGVLNSTTDPDSNGSAIFSDVD